MCFSMEIDKILRTSQTIKMPSTSNIYKDTKGSSENSIDIFFLLGLSQRAKIPHLFLPDELASFYWTNTLEDLM